MDFIKNSVARKKIKKKRKFLWPRETCQLADLKIVNHFKPRGQIEISLFARLVDFRFQFGFCWFYFSPSPPNDHGHQRCEAYGYAKFGDDIIFWSKIGVSEVRIPNVYGYVYGDAILRIFHNTDRHAYEQNGVSFQLVFVSTRRWTKNGTNAYDDIHFESIGNRPVYFHRL